MPTQITSTNYNNQNCTVTLYSATGNTIPYTNATQISLGTQTIPFTYSSTTVSDEYGVFSCFFSGFNSTCTVSQLTPPDGDGNRYKTIKIGNQIWMSENLRTTKFRDGTPLDNLNQVSNETWAAANTDGGKRYWAEYQNKNTYGLLYNQFAVYGTTNSTAICPTGWRVPSNSDFSTLNTYLGANSGTQAKSTTLWSSGNGTNTSGFNGIPNGYRNTSGVFLQSTISAYYQTTNIATFWFLQASSNLFTQANSGQLDGFTVRCIKN